MPNQEKLKKLTKPTVISGFVIAKVNKKLGTKSVRPYTFSQSPERAFKLFLGTWKVSKKEVTELGYKAVPSKMEIDYSDYE